jgi:hypothetical protein
MTEDLIAVLNYVPTARIAERGFTGDWAADRARLLDADSKPKHTHVLIVCHGNHKRSDPAMKPHHGAALMLCKISGFKAVPDAKRKNPRWQIKISEYAHIYVPNVWDGNQKEVRYDLHGSLAEFCAKFGIDPAKLDWQPAAA